MMGDAVDGDMARLVLGAGLFLFAIAYVFFIQLFLVSREKLVAFPLAIFITLVLAFWGVAGLMLQAGMRLLFEEAGHNDSLITALSAVILFATMAFPLVCFACYYGLSSSRKIVFPEPKHRQTYINFIAPMFFNAWVMNLIVMWLSY